jgi:hypothetical protein
VRETQSRSSVACGLFQIDSAFDDKGWTPLHFQKHLANVLAQNPEIKEDNALGKEKNYHKSREARRFDVHTCEKSDPGIDQGSRHREKTQ